MSGHRRRRARARVPVGSLVVVSMTAALLLVTASRTSDAARDPGLHSASPAERVSEVTAESRADMLAQIRHSSRSTARPPALVPALVPARASGKLAFVRLPGAPRARGRTVTYSLQVERGLPVDAREVARTVAAVLADGRGWQSAAGVRFVPVSPRSARAGHPIGIRITLVSPDRADDLCAPLQTEGSFSCWQRGRAVLNARRWVDGAPTYGPDLEAYRTYLINHEVGHGLGRGHARCPKRGARAPVMVQQTKTLEGCTAWPWPQRG